MFSSQECCGECEDWLQQSYVGRLATDRQAGCRRTKAVSKGWSSSFLPCDIDHIDGMCPPGHVTLLFHKEFDFVQVPSIEDKVQATLQNISLRGSDGISDDQLKDFKKRKLISNV